ncbi:MAG: hypothetical protein LLG01_05430 [Planctomycetaceae bacterium]|nr:hypothetical protein [Planctomycetaceae bacterium]
MKRSTTPWVVLVLTAMTAQASAQTAGEQVEDYVGVITGSRVHVRGRADLMSYPCATLSSPATVKVVGSKPGWVKILPPAGTFSAIRTDAIRLDAATGVGTIVDDDVWLRAGGELHSNDFWVIQRYIKRGEKVKVVGTAGKFYKIEPPSDVFFWVAAEFVKKNAEQPQAATAPAAVDATGVQRIAIAPATAPATAPAAAPEARGPVKTTDSEQEIRQAVMAFRQVDTQLRDELAKPVRDQNLLPLADKYDRLRQAKDGYLNPYIDARIKYIQIAIERQKDIVKADEVISTAEIKQKQYDLERSRLGGTTPVLPSFAAMGVLTPSSLFPGTAAAPKRYALFDTRSNSIVAYVQCTTGAVDLQKYASQEVGVLGAKRVENGLGGILLIEATGVQALTAGVRPAPPGRATIVDQPPTYAPPEPKPAPVPAIDETAPPAIVAPPQEPQPQPVPSIEEPPAIAPAQEPKPAEPQPVPPAAPDSANKTAPDVEKVPLIVPRNADRPKPVLPDEPKAPAPPARALPPTGLPMIDSDAPPAQVDKKEFE